MLKLLVLTLALCWPSPSKAHFQADAPVQVPAGGFADYSFVVPPGASVIVRYSPQPVQKAKDLPPGRIIFGGESGKLYTVTITVVDFDKKTVTDADVQFQFGGTPTPPPKPVDPDVKPVDPVVPPTPAKTFRVFLVYETANGKVNLTAAQQGVFFGTQVEGWLNKNVTKSADGSADWRRRDKDSPAGSGVMGQLWTAAKPAFTTFPAVVIEKDGHAVIIPPEATPEAMIAVFEQYLKGAK